MSCFAHSHTAGKWKSRVLKASNLAPELNALSIVENIISEIPRAPVGRSGSLLFRCENGDLEK